MNNNNPTSERETNRQNRPNVSFMMFFNIAKQELSKKINASDQCSWLNDKLIINSYDNLSFKYKNQIFSVLIDIQNKDGHSFLPADKIKPQLEVAKQNNFIPCIFPVIVPEIENFHSIEQLKLKNNGWNLYHTESKQEITPEDITGDEQIETSDTEFQIMADYTVEDYLRTKQCQIMNISHHAYPEPQI
ncbi:MAG: hypothetical protein K6E29_03195 [Cyanobacteria bacterium RUI128]|nr:hypothetical protein [Cyanobacteria bacterium RUI128]